MKVLLINNFSKNLLVGGVENYLVELLKYNESFGSDIEFYWYGKDTKKTNWIKKFYNFNTTSEIVKIIDHFKPDLIHCFGIGAPVSPHFMKYAKQKKIPILFSFRDYYYLFNKENYAIELDPKKNFVFNSLLYLKRKYHKNIIKKYTDYFITPSYQLTNSVEENFGLKGETLFNPILISINDNKVLSHDYILYVGRLEKGKGIISLVESFKMLTTEFPNEKIVIVGSGKMEKTLLDYISKNKLNNIELVGKKNREEIKNYYANAKFVVVPSEILESYGNVVLEAYTFGKTVIISDLVGVKEDVIKYNSGIVFPNGNTTELKNSIKTLIADENLRNQLAENSQHFLEDRTMEKHFNNLKSIYQKLIS